MIVTVSIYERRHRHYTNPFSDVAPGAFMKTRSPGRIPRVSSDAPGKQLLPDAAVTREQFAVMLWNYAQYSGYDVSIGEDTNIFL